MCRMHSRNLQQMPAEHAALFQNLFVIILKNTIYRSSIHFYTYFDLLDTIFIFASLKNK